MAASIAEGVAGTPGKHSYVLLLVHRQHTCGEVYSVAAEPPILSVLALHLHPVGGATVQGVQLEYSVHWQEAGDGEGDGEGGGAIGQAAGSQPKEIKGYLLQPNHYMCTLIMIIVH